MNEGTKRALAGKKFTELEETLDRLDELRPTIRALFRFNKELREGGPEDFDRSLAEAEDED